MAIFSTCITKDKLVYYSDEMKLDNNIFITLYSNKSNYSVKGFYDLCLIDFIKNFLNEFSINYAIAYDSMEKYIKTNFKYSQIACYLLWTDCANLKIKLMQQFDFDTHIPKLNDSCLNYIIIKFDDNKDMRFFLLFYYTKYDIKPVEEKIKTVAEKIEEIEIKADDNTKLLEDKINSISINTTRLENRINAVYNKVCYNNNALETKFDSMQTKFDSMQTNYDSLQTKFDSMQTNYDSMQTNYDSMQTKFDSLNNQFKSLTNTTHDLDLFKLVDMSSIKYNKEKNMLITKIAHVQKSTLDFTNLVNRGRDISKKLTSYLHQLKTLNEQVLATKSENAEILFNLGTCEYECWKYFNDNTYVLNDINDYINNKYLEYYCVPFPSNAYGYDVSIGDEPELVCHHYDVNDNPCFCDGDNNSDCHYTTPEYPYLHKKAQAFLSSKIFLYFLNSAYIIENWISNLDIMIDITTTDAVIIRDDTDELVSDLKILNKKIKYLELFNSILKDEESKRTDEYLDDIVIC
jgi:predicted nuclease with TOPRIM domain